jgi:DNA-binding LacI/PurR family transcriptional regulator
MNVHIIVHITSLYMKHKPRFPTMKDVAKATDVSIQTVSAVINNKPGITQETRDRILAAIAELGYRPFNVARSLRTRTTHTIALIVSDITNPFFATIASIAEDQAHHAGYNLILFNTHSDTEREQYYFKTILDRWIDGVLFVTTLDQLNGLDLVQKAGIPVVALDRIPNNYAGPAVTLDNIKAGRLAAEHLINLGHVHLAHISGPLGLRLSRERLIGYEDTIRMMGISPGPVVSGDTNWSSESGYRAMRNLLALEKRPTAVFAANDRMAIGAMHAITEAGLRVPADISIVGLDNIELAPYQAPPLTTVAQSLTQVATEGVNILLEVLQGKEHSHTQIILEPYLIVRESTGIKQT